MVFSIFGNTASMFTNAHFKAQQYKISKLQNNTTASDFLGNFLEQICWD